MNEAEDSLSDNHSSESSTDNGDLVAKMPIPYSYEPSSSGDTSDTSRDDGSDRLANTSWLIKC